MLERKHPISVQAAFRHDIYVHVQFRISVYTQKQARRSNLTVVADLSLRPALPPQSPLPTAPLRLLKDLHRIDKPIRLRERARVLLDVRLARTRLGLAAALGPHLPRPRPAERGVENDIHVLEVRVDVAVARVPGERGAPLARVRGAGRDIGGDVLAREEPDGDGGAGPVGGVDAAADGVEAGAKVGGVGGQDAAACVARLFGGVGVAVGGVGGARHARLLD